MLLCFHLCLLLDSGSVVSHADPDALQLINFSLFSSQPSSESGMYFRTSFTPNSSICIFRIQIVPIYPASGDPNHHTILKHFHWNSCSSHSLCSFVKPTYKISSYTPRCVIYIGLGGTILFTQEWQGMADLKLAGNANMVLTMKMLMLKEPAMEIFPLFHDSAFFHGLPLS